MIIKDKNILITGASGLVGIEVLNQILKLSPAKVYAVDINISNNLKVYENNSIVEIKKVDLTYLDQCEEIFSKKIDIVLHIAGIKGSPKRTATNPADYFFPMTMFNNNVILASYKAGVDWLVYVSSVGVYAPAEIMLEDDVWTTMPSKNDWYPGWAKRMGEVALHSLKVQESWDNWTVIRPSNIYGKNDNFSPDATVISSNIWKFFNSDKEEIVCWGDGSPKRDFVFADDVAHGIITCVKNEIKGEINFGCGKAMSIKNMIDIMAECYNEITGKTKIVKWDSNMPNGDAIRCLSSTRQARNNLLPKTSLKDGIMKTMKEYSKRTHGKK